MFIYVVKSRVGFFRYYKLYMANTLFIWKYYFLRENPFSNKMNILGVLKPEKCRTFRHKCARTFSCNYAIPPIYLLLIYENCIFFICKFHGNMYIFYIWIPISMDNLPEIYKMNIISALRISAGVLLVSYWFLATKFEYNIIIFHFLSFLHII